ncbi:MAG: hypothetical protein R3F34_07790 [Planctomycetota bacterium]
MIALTTLLVAVLALAPQERATAPALTSELVTAHPGLFEGRYDDVREDLLRALEADPSSPAAYAALVVVQDLASYCAEPLDLERIARLRPRVTDGAARALVASMHESLALRDALQGGPSKAPDDSDLDLVDAWFAIGPFGRLDDDAPLWGPPSAGWPQDGFRRDYDSSFGRKLTWIAAEHDGGTIDPQSVVFPSSGGSLYATAWVSARRGAALLEITCADAYEVWWNGALAARELRRGLTDADPVLRVPVEFGEGANMLTLRFANGDANGFSVRVLESDGRVLDGDVACVRDLGSVPRTHPTVAALPPLPERGARTGYDGVLDMLLASGSSRSDVALAQPEPEDVAVLPAWLRERYFAVATSHHLPAEVSRRMSIEIEDRLAAIGVDVPEIDVYRAHRELDEDRPEEALAIAERLVEAHPDVPTFRWLERDVLDAVDATGTLGRAAAERTLERFDDANSWNALSGESAYANDVGRALDHARRAAFARTGWTVSYSVEWVRLLARGTREQIQQALDLVEGWRAFDPGSSRFEELEVGLWHDLGRDAEILAATRARLARAPLDPRRNADLGDLLLVNGDRDGARAAYERALAIDPSLAAVRRSAVALGAEDEAEAFFREFGPDRDAALARAGEATGASTALLLDSGLVYVRPDGSSIGRNHEITVALDRSGTEQLHERPVAGETHVARVLGADGEVHEPVVVDGQWVMPSLDPGDAVELEFDLRGPSAPGLAPSSPLWRFASFGAPYLLSRFAIFVPDGIPGRFVEHDFDGTHLRFPWRGGVVHVFEVRDEPRYEAEAAQPAQPECLPWVQYGDDFDLASAARFLSREVAYSSSVAADVEVELREFLDEVRADARPEELPRAIFDAVAARLLEFEGTGDTTDVWTLRRGDPTGLLAALYRMADVDFRWVVPYPAAPADIDPTPSTPFADWGAFGRPGLAVGPRDGGDAPTFVFALGRGLPFGFVPEQMRGGRALVLDGDDVAFVDLPEPSPEPDLAVDLELHVAADESASVSGRLAIGGLQGPLLREQLAEAEPQILQQAGRQIASSRVTGLSVADFDVPHLDERGSDFEQTFEGSIRGFAKGSSSKPWIKAPWPRLRLSGRLGKADRRWPLELLQPTSEVSRVTIHPGEAFAFVAAPPSRVVERPGFRYSLEFTLGDDGSLAIERSVRIRGLRLAPEDVPAFLSELEAIEEADDAKIDLVPKE